MWHGIHILKCSDKYSQGPNRVQIPIIGLQPLNHRKYELYSSYPSHAVPCVYPSRHKCSKRVIRYVTHNNSIPYVPQQNRHFPWPDTLKNGLKVRKNTGLTCLALPHGHGEGPGVVIIQLHTIYTYPRGPIGPPLLPMHVIREIHP